MTTKAIFALAAAAFCLSGCAGTAPEEKRVPAIAGDEDHAPVWETRE